MSYRMLGEGVLIRREFEPELPGLEAILFDCDGTLVDARPSYNLTIKLTVMILLNELYGLEARVGDEAEETIHALRMLGGFNNDWYIASALTQAIFLEAGPEGDPKPIKPNIPLDRYLEMSSGESGPEYVIRGMELLKRFAEERMGGYAGPRDVDDFLMGVAGERGLVERLGGLRQAAGLGGRIEFAGSLLARVFDEIYLGREGVRVRRGVEPRYVDWGGAVERERILILRQTLLSLRDVVPKGLGIVTGRGGWETWKTLGAFRQLFREEGCVFISDISSPEFEKPSPKALLKAAENMGVERILYVGNSAEDLIMVRRAADQGLEAAFAGVVENDGSLNYFISRGAEIILDDVNLLPRVFRGEVLWKP